MLAQIGHGLSKNVGLERLNLQSNEISERESIHYLVKGLLDNKEGCQLTDLDLSRNRITSAAIAPLTNLFEQNFKIRCINLRHNMITDEGAQLLV